MFPVSPAWPSLDGKVAARPPQVQHLKSVRTRAVAKVKTTYDPRSTVLIPTPTVRPKPKAKAKPKPKAKPKLQAKRKRR